MDKVWSYIAAAVLVAAVGFLGYGWHRSIVNAEVKEAEFNIEQSFRVQVDEQRKRLLAKVDAAEDKLGSDIQANNKEKDAEIIKLNNTVATLTASLWDRLPRATSSGSGSDKTTGNSTTKTGATGLQLARPDAEFLTWFSGNTAELQTELKACLARDKIVQEALKGFFK